jgi:hypothetical protein
MARRLIRLVRRLIDWSGATPVDSGSNKNVGKRRKHIKKIIYYGSDSSSSSHKDDDSTSSKKKTVKQGYSKSSFIYSRIPYNSNAHLLSIHLGKPARFDGRTILGGAIKCVAIFFRSTLAFGMS